MAVGDLDNNGKDDLILSFPGYGIWSWRNHTNWQQLHAFEALKLAVGDIDGGRVDNLIVDFATYGFWAYRNITAWDQLSPHNVTALTLADLDTNGQADVVASFATSGIWMYRTTRAGPSCTRMSRACSRTGNSMAGRRPISSSIAVAGPRGVAVQEFQRVDHLPSEHQSRPGRRRLRRRHAR